MNGFPDATPVPSLSRRWPVRRDPQPARRDTEEDRQRQTEVGVEYKCGRIQGSEIVVEMLVSVSALSTLARL
ncbi:hypothetical protein I551_5708 [Mycobacterium ulcerans str. Harvey]|uniref:Uncharacterized protein n=1 Tax=Mycobacterium ulcerans str. Harvey TaxID=1299332 RepID=A0ABP3AC54_MYCUL|nr:hypothetical protein I551_5708 [Mycobacterium ulcerans str. Harvey]